MIWVLFGTFVAWMIAILAIISVILFRPLRDMLKKNNSRD